MPCQTVPPLVNAGPDARTKDWSRGQSKWPMHQRLEMKKALFSSGNEILCHWPAAPFGQSTDYGLCLMKPFGQQSRRPPTRPSAGPPLFHSIIHRPSSSTRIHPTAVLLLCLSDSTHASASLTTDGPAEICSRPPPLGLLSAFRHPAHPPFTIRSDDECWSIFPPLTRGTAAPSPPHCLSFHFRSLCLWPFPCRHVRAI